MSFGPRRVWVRDACVSRNKKRRIRTHTMHAAKRNATEQTLLIDGESGTTRSIRSHRYATLRSLLRLAGSGFLIGQSYIDP